LPRTSPSGISGAEEQEQDVEIVDHEAAYAKVLRVIAAAKPKEEVA